MPLPIGPAVAFLFADLESSTRLEQAVGTAAWSAIVGRHDELLRIAEGAAMPIGEVIAQVLAAPARGAEQADSQRVAG